MKSLFGGIVVSAVVMSWGAVSTAAIISYDREQAKLEYKKPGQVPYPAEDPYSLAKADLGRTLFFDPIFSGSQTKSCATCHNPGLSWTDNLAHARGEGKDAMSLRTPTLIDVAWLPKLGWDGKFHDLESVAFTPITGAANMNLPEATLLQRLSAIPGYVTKFQDAFGTADITRSRIESALATFERSIVSGNTPFDAWLSGDQSAMSNAAKRGFDLFNGKAGCANCHSGWAFTDGSFHDIGTARDSDIGRGRLFPTSKMLRYAFKTPTLRDVAHRSPYMHDGSIGSLAEVVDLYDKGGIDRPSRSESIHPLGLTADEKSDLIAFLGSLTEKPEAVPVPVLPR